MLKDSLLVNLNKYPKREAWSPDENPSLSEYLSDESNRRFSWQTHIQLS